MSLSVTDYVVPSSVTNYVLVECTGDKVSLPLLFNVHLVLLSVHTDTITDAYKPRQTTESQQLITHIGIHVKQHN
jgi:hypothetical protein